jgi:psp operon transcriptional activator
VDAYAGVLLVEALARPRWNQRPAAAAMGLSYDQLRHCIKKHRLSEGGITTDKGLVP